MCVNKTHTHIHTKPCKTNSSKSTDGLFPIKNKQWRNYGGPGAMPPAPPHYTIGPSNLIFGDAPFIAMPFSPPPPPMKVCPPPLVSPPQIKTPLEIRDILYAQFHRHETTYRGLGYTSCETLDGTRNRPMGPTDRADNWPDHELSLSYVLFTGWSDIAPDSELIYIESLMSCHLLLNLLHELANMLLCEALPSIISFLPTNVINLVINDNEFEILFIT